MLSQQYTLQEKSIWGYFVGIVDFISGLFIYAFIGGIFGIFGLILVILYVIPGIIWIYRQIKHNRGVPENNLIVKYILYIEQAHSEIPEKYHEAILSKLLRNL